MEKQIEILKKFEEKEWITKNKRKIKIKDLDLDHLKNIVKNLKKRFKQMEDPENDYPSFDGEMAQMAADYQWRKAVAYYNQLKREVELFECYYKLKKL